MKTYTEFINESEKSKKIIGYTKSGKAVYDKLSDQIDFDDFTDDERKDAIELHHKEVDKILEVDRFKSDRKTRTKKYDKHYRSIQRHTDFIKEKPKYGNEEAVGSLKSLVRFGKTKY